MQINPFEGNSSSVRQSLKMEEEEASPLTIPHSSPSSGMRPSTPSNWINQIQTGKAKTHCLFSTAITTLPKFSNSAQNSPFSQEKPGFSPHFSLTGSHPGRQVMTLPFGSNLCRSLTQDFDEEESTPKKIRDANEQYTEINEEKNNSFVHTPPKYPKKLKNPDNGYKNEKIEQMDLETTAKKFRGNGIVGSSDDQNLFSANPSELLEETKLIGRFYTDYGEKTVIGEGSFGKVYRCIKKLGNTEVAIKETTRKCKGHNKARATEEARALASLNADEGNPYVIRYYSSWIENESFYLEMECCKYSLKMEIERKQRFSESEIKKMLRDICLGLRYMHRRLFAHMDLKPENIMVSENHTYKIGDFGQSRKSTCNLCKEDIEEGDSRYLALELLESKDMELDLTKSDIFSLGMTLYEIVTGENLEGHGDRWHAIREGHLEELDFAYHISSNLKDLIKKMINRDPLSRPSANDILHNYVPSKRELELKWSRVSHKLLKDRSMDLEERYCKLLKRRKSFQTIFDTNQFS